MAAGELRISKGKNWIALDAGGTMTDAVIVDGSATDAAASSPVAVVDPHRCRFGCRT